jgi:two-component system sensor histidine kinase KdpD
MKAKAIVGPWPVTERLLVCIAPSPYAKQLIRKAYQLADEIKAEWYAVYVESIAQLQLDDIERGRLAETLEYAEELGAKVRTISGTDVAEELLRFAEQEKVTRIMVGKPVKKTLTNLFASSPITRLINSRKGTDIYLIEPNVDADAEKQKKDPKKRKTLPDFKLMDYFYSFLLLIPVIALGFLLSRVVRIENFSIIFIISVVSSAFLFGTGPSVFVSMLSILSYDYFFVEPYYSFTIGKPEYVVEILIFLLVSAVMGEIARLFRRQREALRIRLENIRMLEQMGRELLSVPTIEQVLDTSLESKNTEMVETIQLINVDILEQVSGIVSGYMTRVIKQPNVIIFRDRDGKIKVWARSDAGTALNQNDYAIANWVYEKGEPAGLGTRTLTASEFVFVPMNTKAGIVGVIGIKSDYSQLLPQDKYFITAISDFAAIAAEKCARMMGKV